MINFWEIRKERERELSSQNIPWENLLISATEELLKLTMPFNSCGIGVEYTTLELSKDISGGAMNYIYIISKKNPKPKWPQHSHWRQTGLKSGGAEWEFETYLVKIRDYETKKTAGAPEPPEPPSLAPMSIWKI